MSDPKITSLPQGLGKVSGLCLGDRAWSCQEVFAAAWDVPALCSFQTIRLGTTGVFMQTLLVSKPQMGLEVPGWHLLMN